MIGVGQQRKERDVAVMTTLDVRDIAEPDHEHRRDRYFGTVEGQPRKD